MSNSIPVPPTPPMTKKARTVIYACWGWATLLLATTIVIWEMANNAPQILYAINVGLAFFGAGAGFMAKNNVY